MLSPVPSHTSKTATVTRQPSPARLSQLLAAYLNAVDALDRPSLLTAVEELLHPLGIAGWPLDVSPQRVAAWGLNTRETASLIDRIRMLGVEL